MLTAPQIYDMYENLISTWPILKNGAPKNLSDFLSAQDAVGDCGRGSMPIRPRPLCRCSPSPPPSFPDPTPPVDALGD